MIDYKNVQSITYVTEQRPAIIRRVLPPKRYADMAMKDHTCKRVGMRRFFRDVPKMSEAVRKHLFAEVPYVFDYGDYLLVPPPGLALTIQGEPI